VLSALTTCAPAGVVDEEVLHSIEAACDASGYVAGGVLFMGNGDVRVQVTLSEHGLTAHFEEDDSEDDLEDIGVDNDRG
jgi:hypothetical protein